MSTEKVIVALDQMSLEDIDVFLKNPENKFSFVKIGLELFVKYGPDLVHRIHNDYHKKIFLDLKLHDIPVTVAKAVAALKNLPIHMLTVHLSGGEKMLTEALAEARRSIPQCKILGVSFLTSLEASDLKTMFNITDTDAAFNRLFNLASESGIDGVICSPLEAKLVKKSHPHLLAVTPGIRFEDEINSTQTQDQKRVATPSQAFTMGSDYLVIGRSLTKAKDLSSRISELKSLSKV
jgi:orotidine-5'-phosphate decarboxylase